MTTLTSLDFPGERELVLTRVIDAPPERVFKAWTTQLPQWWGPNGTTIPFCEMDLRAGGVFRTVLRASNGDEYPTRGCFLEVVENKRIVFTDAYDPGWKPHPDAFYTCVVTFDTWLVDKTNYTARALHWTVGNRQKHKEMGFHEGWGESLDRLVAIVLRN